mgnify:CR=1 FL=1
MSVLTKLFLVSFTGIIQKKDKTGKKIQKMLQNCDRRVDASIKHFYNKGYEQAER